MHLLELLQEGPLFPDDIKRAVDCLLDESVEDHWKEEFLSRLHERGETVEEIAGFAEAFLAHAQILDIPDCEECIDVCGTGGDRAGFFNVSTAVMFVVAAAGVRVVKHGNRGMTSRSGAADVMEALKIPLGLSALEAKCFLNDTGYVMLFAPAYHPAFRVVAPVRRALAARGQATIFNILGPLLNPARPGFQLVGLSNGALLEEYARVLRVLGRRRAWVVHGTTRNGGPLDEISLGGVTGVASLQEGEVRFFNIDPRDMGFDLSEDKVFWGGNPMENAALITDILAGKIRDARRDLVVINAAAALCLADKASDLMSGIGQANDAIDSGRAFHVLRLGQR